MLARTGRLTYLSIHPVPSSVLDGTDPSRSLLGGHVSVFHTHTPPPPHTNVEYVRACSLLCACGTVHRTCSILPRSLMSHVMMTLHASEPRLVSRVGYGVISPSYSADYAAFEPRLGLSDLDYNVTARLKGVSALVSASLSSHPRREVLPQ